MTVLLDIAKILGLRLHLKGVSEVTRIMNVDEVARYLGVVPDTIYRKARRGEIPAVKMGKMWRFPKETLDKWLNDSALESIRGQEKAVSAS